MKRLNPFIETFSFTFLVTFLALVFFIIAGLIPQLMGYVPLIEYRTSIFITSFFYLFLINILQKRWNINLKKMFISANSVIYAVVMILSISFYCVSVYIFQSLEDYNNLFIGYIHSMQFKTPSIKTTEIIQILNIVIVSPIAEEIFFRGLVFKFLLKERSFLKSIIFSSILFSLFHFRFSNIFLLFLLGCVLAYILYKTGSLILSICAHMLFNFISVFAEDLKIPITSISNIQLFLIVISIFIFIFSLIFLSKYEDKP